MLISYEQVPKITIRVLLFVGVVVLWGGVVSNINVNANGFPEPEKVANQGVSTTKKVKNMAMPQIIEQIKNKDWTFTEDETPIEPRLTPELMSLCEHEDEEIRELVLYAINAIPGQEARNCIIKSLHDDDINVRSVASRFLQNNYTKQDVKKLHAELSVNDDELVRESILLVLGLIGDSSSKDVIEKHALVEKDGHAIHAIHLAMVRLRDESHRREYTSELRDGDPKKRVQALHDFKYIQDRDFLSQIKLLIFDKNIGVNVGPSKSKILLRVCDVAVYILDQVLKHPFPFEVTHLKSYTSEELIDADKVIQRMLP